MMENMSSLKITNVNLQEAPRPSQRARQGTAPSDERAGSAGGVARAKPMEPGKVQALASKMNQALKEIDSNFSVSYDDAADMMVVRITDAETGEIVKQVPPQQVLDANVSVEKIIGLLVNDHA